MTRRKSTANTLFALANVLTSAATVAADVLHGIEFAAGTGPRSQREHLHQQGLALKNRLTAEKIASEQIKRQVTANREIKTGLDIDLAALKIRREEFNQVSSGILPPEQAQYYKRPKFAKVE